MAAPAHKIDRLKYGELLARTLPKRIETEEDNECFLAEVEALIDKGPAKSPEENVLLMLLTTLIEQFEEKHYPMPDLSPREALQELMRDRGLRQCDLLEVFGSDGVASDVVNGKRGISKNHAKKLAELFHVPLELFI